jgi:hypothetical protein
MFHIFIMFYFCTILCGACVFHDVWAFASQMFFNVTQNHLNFSTNCSKACCMKNQMNEKWPVRLCIFLFLQDWLLSANSVNAHVITDSVLYLGKSQCCWWLGHFGLQNSIGLLALVQHWRDVIRRLSQSIPPTTLHFIPPSSPKGRGAICVL